MNDLIAELNVENDSMAYADDIEITCVGEYKLYQAVQILRRWTKENKMSINYGKSGILVVRNDKHTKPWPSNKLHNFPVKQKYKYLGVTIEDDG